MLHFSRTKTKGIEPTDEEKVKIKIPLKNGEYWEEEFKQDDIIEDVINKFKTANNEEFPDDYIKDWKNKNQTFNINDKIRTLLVQEVPTIISDPQIKRPLSLGVANIPNVIGKPFNDPFEVFVFYKKNKILKIQKYENEIIEENELDSYGPSSAYCNGNNCLFISGGEKINLEIIKNFWIIYLETGKEKIDKTEMPAKKNHSMIYIPGNYIFVVGGDDLKTFYYDLENNEICFWGNLNKKRLEPSLALISNYLYCFDNTNCNNNNQKFTIEKTDLNSENFRWEIFEPNMEPSLGINKINQKFFATINNNNDNIIFIGGNMDGDNDNKYNYKYNVENNQIEFSNIPFEEYNFKEKTFLTYNKKIDYILPDFNRYHPEVIFYQKEKEKISLIKYEPNKGIKNIPKPIIDHKYNFNMPSLSIPGNEQIINYDEINKKNENENNINENNINENEYENEKNENNSKKEDGSKEDINSQIEKKSSESNNNASNNSEKKEDIKKSSVILDKEKDNQFQVNISGSVGSGNINILKNQPPKNFEDLTKLPNDNESLKNIHDQSNVKVTIENDIKVPDIIVPKNEDINNNLSPNDNPTDTLKNQFDIKPIDQGNLKINIGEQNNNNNINIDGSNILPQINVNQKIDLEDRFSQVHTEEKDGKFTMSGIIKGIKKDVKIDLPNANINNVNNQNININGNITGVNVNGPKVDLNGPKVNIKESYLSGIIQGTNVKEHSINIPSGNINVKKPEFKNNLDINPPKIKGSNFVGNNSNDLEFKIPSAKVDINGPKINSPNININGNGPDFNVKAPETDIKINKLSKDFNLSGIIPGYKPGNVNLQGPNIKSPNINIEGKSKDININPKMNLPSLGGDIKLNNDFNIKGPTIDKNQDFIGINFNNPSINKEINIKGNSPGINIDGQKMPNLKLNGNLDGELPNINGPDIDGKTANLNINPPQVKKIPDFNAKGPGLDMNKNNCDFYISGIVPGNPNPKMNSININGNMTGINVNSQKYDINGNMPGINVNAPYINLKGSKPNINGSNNLSGIIAGKNVKGSNINMSSGNININGPEINKSGNININAQKFEGPNVDLNIKGNKMNMPNTILPDSSLNGKLDGNINIKGGNTNINGNLPGINVKGSKIDINNNIINSNASIVSSSYNFLLSGIIPSKNDKNRQVQILQSKGPGNISVKGPSINVNNNSKIKFHGNIDDNNLGIDMNNLKGSRALKINNDSTNFNLGKHYLDINNNNNIGGLNNGNEELEGGLKLSMKRPTQLRDIINEDNKLGININADGGIKEDINFGDFGININSNDNDNNYLKSSENNNGIYMKRKMKVLPMVGNKSNEFKASKVDRAGNFDTDNINIDISKTANVGVNGQKIGERINE